MTTERGPIQSALMRRLPLFIVLGLGFILWQNGFGLFATERRIEWRLPVPYGQLKSVELQVWRGEALLNRQTLNFSAGRSEAIESHLPLTRGEHQAIATVQFVGGETKTFRQPFNPENEPVVIVDFGKR